MEVSRNKNSGEYFAFISESEDGSEYLLVNPLGQVKSFRTELFDDPVDLDKKILRSQNMLSDVQIRKARESKKEMLWQDLRAEFSKAAFNKARLVLLMEETGFIEKLQKELSKSTPSKQSNRPY